MSTPKKEESVLHGKKVSRDIWLRYDPYKIVKSNLVQSQVVPIKYYIDWYQNKRKDLHE